MTKKEKREAWQVARSLAVAYTASIMCDRLKKDFPGHDMVAAVTDPNLAIETLTLMVEGDDVIDDGPTHAFFRKLLDEHREGLARIDQFFGFGNVTPIVTPATEAQI